MITFVFSVYDAAVKAFLPPFFSRSKGEAIRSFSDAVNDEKSQLNKHVRDYSLFYIASFDDGSGAFDAPTAPERVVTGVEVLSVDDVFPADRKVS